MDDKTEARRAALRRFISKEGGNSVVGRKYGLSTSRLSYLSQLITPGSKIAFGERSARKWQEEFGLTDESLVNPLPLVPENLPEPTIKEVVFRLAQILRGVPDNQREVTSSLLAALGKTPDDQLAAVLTQLLESQLPDWRVE